MQSYFFSPYDHDTHGAKYVQSCIWIFHSQTTQPVDREFTMRSLDEIWTLGGQITSFDVLWKVSLVSLSKIRLKLRPIAYSSG